MHRYQILKGYPSCIEKEINFKLGMLPTEAGEQIDMERAFLLFYIELLLPFELENRPTSMKDIVIEKFTQPGFLTRGRVEELINGPLQQFKQLMHNFSDVSPNEIATKLSSIFAPWMR